MIWLDFFLQTFVHALAWCLAVVTTLSMICGGAWTVLSIYARLPLMRGAGR